MVPTNLNPDHRKTQAAYDRLSRWYDLLEGNWEKSARDAGLRLLAASPGEKILELGPGTGSVCLELSRASGPDGRIFAIDLSTGMLDAARRRLKSTAQTDRSFFSAGDACRLPVRPACFDAVYSSFMLELFTDEEIPIVLNECRRVLKPGGRICIVSLTASGRPSQARRIYTWCHNHFPDLVDCRPICVKSNLDNTGYRVDKCLYTTLWRIPVEIVLASKP
jgi:demethylmenaquinone methyltransferase/2-methoxy-6-polyprenyl-1,4-benzoquinol methylase